MLTHLIKHEVLVQAKGLLSNNSGQVYVSSEGRCLRLRYAPSDRLVL